MAFTIELTGKVALITGGDSGIGQGCARALAQAGADVVVNFRSDKDGANETRRIVEREGRRAITVRADVGEPDQVENMFRQVDDAFGRFDILVNNAGIGGSGPVEESSFTDWERVIRTNLHGPFLCAQQAVRRMLAQGDGGRIINITSVHEEAPNPPGNAAYNASKGGLKLFTRSMALEFAHEGILVTNVAPGMIFTPMNAEVQEDPEKFKEVEEMIPTRRVGTPEDVANMVVFLASDKASYCTGMTFYVDGGWMLNQPPI